MRSGSLQKEFPIGTLLRYEENATGKIEIGRVTGYSVKWNGLIVQVVTSDFTAERPEATWSSAPWRGSSNSDRFTYSFIPRQYECPGCSGPRTIEPNNLCEIDYLCLNCRNALAPELPPLRAIYPHQR